MEYTNRQLYAIIATVLWVGGLGSIIGGYLSITDWRKGNRSSLTAFTIALSILGLVIGMIICAIVAVVIISRLFNYY